MDEVKPGTFFQRVELPCSRIDDEIVFFDHNTGKYYATGPVGADIWEFLADRQTLSAICDHLMMNYDINRSTCEAEVYEFLREMVDAGVVRII
ncbi:MAG: PqqD family peptide modification chaperone [Hyphomonadaceae bacterium]|nr:PqqD family peptide modification chaperone [Hyphomonadaceae bacterium]MBY0565145.1 PqqD family peptide modification chaperone [Hyphomonadaceae bacterium]